MGEFRPRHVVIVRHGESEGDFRRSMRRQGVPFDSKKHPRDEEQTKRGHEQSAAAGRWIAKYILDQYGITFDKCFRSPLLRTQQSANSLGLSDNWYDEPAIAERDRGDIQGMTNEQHQELYPDSYRQMREHPFHWVPPNGESLLRVSYKVGEFLDTLDKGSNYLFMTHRDVMWSTHIPIDGVSLAEIEQIDTDAIGNGHIFHCTNVNPYDGTIVTNELDWKHSINPLDASSTATFPGWLDLSLNKESLSA